MAKSLEPTAPSTASDEIRPAPDPAAHHAGQFKPDRLTFFSDGVMAIAITLLVFDIPIPQLGASPTDAQLWDALAGLRPEILAFVLSFAVISLWWNNHHRLFNALEAADTPLLILNLVFLAAVAFLPLPTAILGRFPPLATSVVLYASANALIGIVATVMAWYSLRAGLVAESDRAVLRRRILYTSVAPAVFLVSIPLAVVDPNDAPWSWQAIWMILVGVRVVWPRLRRAR